MRRSTRLHLGFIAASFAAAAIGSLFQPGVWYAGLEKPALNPPNWIFGPVWSALYVCMGIAAARVRARSSELRPMLLWVAQLALNATWSWLFFGLHRPDLAFMEILMLWISIALTAHAFWRTDRRAAALMLPYLAWVSFAAWLNFALWQLNR